MWDSMSDSGRGIWLLLITLGVGGACLYGARALYTWWTGIELPSNLLELTGGLIRGQQPRAVAVLALLILLTGIAGLVAIVRWRNHGLRQRKRGDQVARKSASRREVAVLGKKAALSSAAQLGVSVNSPGLPIGRMVAGGAPLFSSWEFVSLMIAGPRTGKTTAFVVPRIFAAPGAVLATSNKRDIVDITREQRSQSGKTWVFDPQGIAGEAQSWWWDILAGIKTPVDAVSLAEVFIDSQRDATATKNAYFDGASKDLLAALLLAAALGDRDIRAVHDWLTRPLS